MKRIAYFLTDFQGAYPSAGILEKYGLSYALEGESLSCIKANNPLGGGFGSIVAVGDPKGLPEMIDFCDWYKNNPGKNGDQSLVGIPKDSKYWPGPDQLQRKKLYTGYSIKLCDGNEWIIPVFRFADGNRNLPQILGIDEDGLPCRMTSPIYSRLESLCDSIWFNETAPKENRIKIDDAVVAVLGGEALKVNYRISMFEALGMKLLSDDNIAKISEALLDIPALNILEDDLSKKKRATLKYGVDSIVGEEEKQDTTQPTQK